MSLTSPLFTVGHLQRRSPCSLCEKKREREGSHHLPELMWTVTAMSSSLSGRRGMSVDVPGHRCPWSSFVPWPGDVALPRCRRLCVQSSLGAVKR